MEMPQITEAIHIPIPLQDNVRGQERAFDMARRQALNIFGIDDHGHSSRIKGWERCCCSVNIKQIAFSASGGMGGWEYVYEFEAWCEKHGDD